MRKIKNDSTIMLGPKDSAFVVREDGNQEIYIPTMHEDEDDCICASAEIMLFMACMLDDKKVMQMVEKMIKDA